MTELSGIEYNGKMYVPVVERVRWFRSKHPTWSILTEVKRHDSNVGGLVLVQATIVNETGGMVASGHSCTVIGTGRGPAGDAALEFTETKAIGRALACFGVPGGEYASAEEMWMLISSTLPVNDAVDRTGSGNVGAADEVCKTSSSSQANESRLVGDEHQTTEPNTTPLREAAKAIAKFVERQDSESLRESWESNKALIDDIKKNEPASYKELVKRFKARKQELEKTDVNEL